MDYIAYLHRNPETHYGVSVPDFPGCVTAGNTPDEARTPAREVLEFHIDEIIRNGGALPAPSSLFQLKDDPRMAGAMAFIVTVQPPASLSTSN